jgi:hypothetical protein
MLTETLLRIPENSYKSLPLDCCTCTGKVYLCTVFFLFRNSKPLKKINNKEDNVLLAFGIGFIPEPPVS